MKQLKTTPVFIALGANMGNTFLNIINAQEHIEKNIGPITKYSSLIQSQPWGNVHQQNDFLNRIIIVETVMSPETVMDKLLEIELQMGRVRKEKWGPRIIDLDMIYYGDRIIHSKSLEIPHPRLQERKFVLFSLNEIAPEYLHPVAKKTNHQLFLECTDNSEIHLYNPDR